MQLFDVVKKHVHWSIGCVCSPACMPSLEKCPQRLLTHSPCLLCAQLPLSARPPETLRAPRSPSTSSSSAWERSCTRSRPRNSRTRVRLVIVSASVRISRTLESVRISQMHLAIVSRADTNPQAAGKFFNLAAPHSYHEDHHHHHHPRDC